VMPDLLPKKSNCDSQNNISPVSANETHSRDNHNPNHNNKSQQCTIVEVKEREMNDRNNKFIDNENVTKTGQIVDTVSILESCKQFEPQQVETVNIIDASSDTDYSANSTPQLVRKPMKSNNGSIDELKTELKRELETISNFEVEIDDDDENKDENSLELVVKKQRISFDERVKLGKDRDVLLDSEKSVISGMKIRPTLQELLMEERNSFYSADKENDEPLEFSDDEEIPRYSMEMDSDSDLV
jgi:hypothetical protein